MSLAVVSNGVVAARKVLSCGIGVSIGTFSGSGAISFCPVRKLNLFGFKSDVDSEPPSAEFDNNVEAIEGSFFF